METPEQKKRRLFGKQDIGIYLVELNNILKFHVESADLISLVDTDQIRQMNLGKILKSSFKILFKEKAKLEDIIRENAATGAEFYLFTKYSKDCGAVFMGSFDNFNFDFSFNSMVSTLITFTEVNLSLDIILDFYEENGVESLEIEIYGK